MAANNLIDTSEQWDVIVIGAGMGGGAAAHRLTELGHSVLLLEKGLDRFATDDPASLDSDESDPDKRLGAGRWPTKIAVTVDGNRSEIWPALGCGVGGSTLLYASALSRLEPEDFDPQQTPAGETIEWPYSYTELEPYYLQAEALLGVRGTVDPRDDSSTYDLQPPPAMGKSDRRLFQCIRASGLNPYRIHVGIEYRAGCSECGGHVCGNSCKQDSRHALIDPARHTGRLTLWTTAEVEHVEADSRAVRHIRVRHEGTLKMVSARHYVMAAGGLVTPIILQRSRNADWPDGLGNRHDIVGRYLMFHTSDYIAFWTGAGSTADEPGRTIAFRDYYSDQGQRFGEVQSTGLTAGYGNILHYLNLQYDQSPFRRLRILRPLLRTVAFIASRLFKQATVLATIVQDHPYFDNRVLWDLEQPSSLSVEYTVHAELAQRTRELRRSLLARLKPLRGFPLFTGINLNYGHVCGTCRSGRNPETSVVDGDCRVHGLDNLYVVDSSFMPTSGGANPSLTIAANALRVADRIGERLEAEFHQVSRTARAEAELRQREPEYE